MSCFAELTTEQVAFMVAYKADKAVVSYDEINKILEVFHLNGKNTKEVASARNSVVRLYAEIRSNARANGDWELFDRMNNNMSAMTCAFDVCMVGNCSY